MKASRAQRLVIAALVVMTAMAAWYRPLQDIANAQIDAGLKRALISFASARVLNGVISVFQGTELSIEPLGVGVTLTPGQILDPINDLIEEFSSVMLVASVAFGVQKMLLTIGAHVVVSIAVTGMALTWAVLFYLQRAPVWLSRVLVVLLMVRFAMPVVTVGSDWIFQNFLAKDYNADRVALEAASKKLSKSMPSSNPASVAPPASQGEQGFLDGLKELKDRAKSMVTIPRVDLQAIKQSADDLAERVLRLIVVFLMQTIIVPLLLLWTLYRALIAVVPSTPFPRAPGDATAG